jgi:WhiB family redox-sensing transcriptional regulator
MQAKQMCRQCPVMTQCRTHALTVGEPYGIWGGLSESERELLLKRGIGRRSA